MTRRGWLVIGLVGALAFLGGIGLFKLLVGDEDGSADRLAVTGTPTAEPTDVPTDEPTAEPSPTPRSVATLQATLTASPSLTPAGTATPKPTPSRTASPAPRPTTKSPTPKPTTSSPTPSPTSTGTTYTMHMRNFTFSPSAFAIKVGDSIRAVTDEGSHTFTSETGPESWDSKGASSYTWTFKASGNYTFVCSYHTAQGMRGTITVQ